MPCFRSVQDLLPVCFPRCRVTLRDHAECVASMSVSLIRLEFPCSFLQPLLGASFPSPHLLFRHFLFSSLLSSVLEGNKGDLAQMVDPRLILCVP